VRQCARRTNGEGHSISFVRLVKHGAGKMRALLLKGTPFVIAEIDEDIGQGTARERERTGTSDGDILFLADEMLAGDRRMREQFVAHGQPRAARGKPSGDHNKILCELASRHVLGFDAVNGKSAAKRALTSEGFGLLHSLNPQSVLLSLGIITLTFVFTLCLQSESIHRRAVRTQLSHLLARAVPERAARADRGAHRFFARAGAVVAHIAFDHELHRLGLFWDAKRTRVNQFGTRCSGQY
jgi:hypothetical protein